MIGMTGCKSRSAGSVSGNGFYFDTIVSFTVYGTEDTNIIDELKEKCALYEKIFSTTDKESELYKLNSGEIKKVSADLYQCVKTALEYCRQTNGRYDISIRPVSELWDFNEKDPVIPEKEKISSGLEYVDYSKIDISEENVIKMPYGMKIDLGSAAKGYIADRLCEFLTEKGITSAIVSLGGNVQCLGKKISDNGKTDAFRIAIKSPFPDKSDEYADILSVKDKAVVTSGIYERCFTKENILYHHILDGKTGFPVENDLASVTIVSSSGLEADILSTVCFLEGYENVLKKFYEKDKAERFEAEFIYKDGSVKKTAGFDDYK